METNEKFIGGSSAVSVADLLSQLYS